MKWPTELVLVRHAESAYNLLKHQLRKDPRYPRFIELFEAQADDDEIHELADELQHRYELKCSDRDTRITPLGERQAWMTGLSMKQKEAASPDIIFVSPYFRTQETLRIMTEAWPALEDAKIVLEERIREQDHGLALLYVDWRIFHLKHPDQARLSRMVGEYDYRFVNGENVPDVRMRNLSWISTLTRDFAGRRVMAITHHLTILATRANFERHGPEEFLRQDREDTPVNCGVTRYVGDPEKGVNGRLELREYNHCHYLDQI